MFFLCIFFELDSFLNMIRLNPQLRCLFVGSFYDVQILRCAIKHLEFLECLHMFTIDLHLEQFGDDVINFASLKQIKLKLIGPIKKIPISSNCFEEFSLQSEILKGEEKCLIDFLKIYPSITKLSLCESPLSIVRKDTYIMENRDSLTEIIELLLSFGEIVITAATNYKLLKFELFKDG